MIKFKFQSEQLPDKIWISTFKYKWSLLSHSSLQRKQRIKLHTELRKYSLFLIYHALLCAGSSTPRIPPHVIPVNQHWRSSHYTPIWREGKRSARLAIHINLSFPPWVLQWIRLYEFLRELKRDATCAVITFGRCWSLITEASILSSSCMWPTSVMSIHLPS